MTALPSPPVQPFIVYFAGYEVTLTPIVLGEPPRVRGYHLICPSCQRGMFVNTGLGEKPDHIFMRDADGKATLTPNIDCPFPNCDWQARLSHGILYNARRRSDQIRFQE